MATRRRTTSAAHDEPTRATDRDARRARSRTMRELDLTRRMSSARSSASRCSSLGVDHAHRAAPAGPGQAHRLVARLVAPWFGTVRWLLPVPAARRRAVVARMGPGKRPNSRLGDDPRRAVLAYVGVARRVRGPRSRAVRPRARRRASIGRFLEASSNRCHRAGRVRPARRSGSSALMLALQPAPRGPVRRSRDRPMGRRDAPRSLDAREPARGRADAAKAAPQPTADRSRPTNGRRVAVKAVAGRAVAAARPRPGTIRASAIPARRSPSPATRPRARSPRPGGGGAGAAGAAAGVARPAGAGPRPRRRHRRAATRRRPATASSTTLPPIAVLDDIALPRPRRRRRDGPPATPRRSSSKKLASFGIPARIVGAQRRPGRHPVRGPAGDRTSRLSRIEALSDDLAMALAARSLRIEAPIPGKSAVGIEIPNKDFNVVALRRILEEKRLQAHRLEADLRPRPRRGRARPRRSTWPRCPTCSSPAPPARARASWSTRSSRACCARPRPTTSG